MSRSFNGTSDYLEYTGGVRTSLPITLAAWAYKSTSNQTRVAVSIGDVDSLNRVSLVFISSANVRATSVNTSGTGAVTDTSTTFSANTWAHGAAVFTSTTSRTVYLNGGGSSTSTTSNDPSAANFDTTNIGCINNSSGRSTYFDGRLAEVGVWSVALTAAEVASLAKGISPLSVRPGSLIAYWPLIGNASPEIELRNRYEMTVSGATKEVHPRVYMPRNAMIQTKTSATTIKVPVLYRQRQMQGMAA